MNSSSTENTRILLRAPEPEDLDFLYTIENDQDLWEITALGGPYSRYALRQYIASLPTSPYSAEAIRFIVSHAKNGKKLGLIDLTDLNPRDRRAEIGIAFLRSERNKGYARESLHALEHYARDILNLRLLYAQVPTLTNPQSSNLFRKCGYEAVACLPEWHYHNGEYEDISIFLKKLSKKTMDSLSE